MSKIVSEVYVDGTYGLYDLNNGYFTWLGNLDSVINQLVYENSDLEDISYLTFLGHNMYQQQNLTEKDLSFLVSLDDLPLNHNWGYKEIKNNNLYGNRQYVLVKQVDSKQINVNIFDIWKKYKYRTYPNEDNDFLEYFEQPNFRKGAIKGRQSKRMKRKHKKNYTYRRPNLAGRRLELSRFNEDKLVLKNLSKKSLIDLDWAIQSKLMNTWKDKKVRHQWEVKTKKI